MVGASLLPNTNFLALARVGEDGGDAGSLEAAKQFGAANPSMVLNTSFLAFAVRTGVDGGAESSCEATLSEQSSDFPKRKESVFFIKDGSLSSGSNNVEVSSAEFFARPRRRFDRFFTCIDRLGEVGGQEVRLGEGGQEGRRGDFAIVASSSALLERLKCLLDKAFCMPFKTRRGELIIFCSS